MNTKFWTVDNNNPLQVSYPQIEEAAEQLKRNGTVAFPTETVYGLGANALSNEAVIKIYEAKMRPSDNPLIVHISKKEQLPTLVDNISIVAEKMINSFWPGPLTLVLPKKEGLSDYVTAGLDTVAIRMPSHPVALALIDVSGLPLAAPSANLSGKPSPTTANHVREDLFGRIAGIVDGGTTGVGLESTVVDCTTGTPIILRPGGITKEQLEEVVGTVEVDPALLKNEENIQPKSPGMKYTHYSPIAPVYLVDGNPSFFAQTIKKALEEGKKVGVLATKETIAQLPTEQLRLVAITCGTKTDLQTVAAHLYDALRSFNSTDVDIIYSEVFPEYGVGAAIMNRLEKAAGHKWIREGRDKN
ncbi:L-threonylcarbamoyladenylate synthase [Sutcliffiella rhizosphaerae]|uniref:Threonylcarbamoyl-AMP synthase n=1 Tax=Sutcliffiella rhizosphaerae TaxID=2880967 RepID=A0ABM8YJR3_9BACI|nr:L-threonylcarbamoyladenylate synthase [Sutcliffiella rhizosphaerae]CAG9620121.1 Threonylcarbamoyl-AMP synthase [Sutcliffiella rhizosphaerae]